MFNIFELMKAFFYALIVVSLVACEQQVQQSAQIIDLEEFTQIIENSSSDKIQVINFWATWCKPCVEELPAFEKIQSNYSEEVEVILISLDDEKNLEQLVNPFLASNNIQSQVKLMTHPYAAEWIPLVDPHWDGAIPVTLIKHKSNQRFYNQSFTYDELEAAIEPFLK